ncbi:MAG: lamin tail domain-containing protein [Myxococcales bacterium]|nr:MAG: lamin tail domain-containing protein [Myxococcales bacterium]
MKTTRSWARFTLVWALPVAACSTVVGADFDGLEPVGSAGSSAGGATAGAGASGGTGGQAQPPLGGAGAGAAQGGSSQAGTSSGGSGPGGVGGEPVGGAPPAGGAASGGAGSGGESGEGGEGGEPTTLVPPTAVVINELKGQGSGDDYIELYNPGPETADVGGCYVVDDSNNRVTLPPGATIAPDGYVVIRLQQTASTGLVTTCFGFTPCYDGVQWGISAGGEVIFLHDSKGVLLDQLTYPNDAGPNNVGDGHALGRIPDGAASTGAILTSPGATNNAVP